MNRTFEGIKRIGLFVHRDVEAFFVGIAAVVTTFHGFWRSQFPCQPMGRVDPAIRAGYWVGMTLAVDRAGCGSLGAENCNTPQQRLEIYWRWVV